MTSIDTLAPLLPHRAGADIGSNAAAGDGSAEAGQGAGFGRLLDGLSRSAEDQPQRAHPRALEHRDRSLRPARALRQEDDPARAPDVAEPREALEADEADGASKTAVPDALLSLLPSIGAALASLSGRPTAPDGEAGEAELQPAAAAEPGKAGAAGPGALVVLKATILQNETHFAPVQQQPDILRGTAPGYVAADQPIHTVQEAESGTPAETSAAPSAARGPSDADAKLVATTGPAGDHAVHRAAGAQPQPKHPDEAGPPQLRTEPVMAPPPPASGRSSNPAPSVVRQIAEAVAARIPPAHPAGTAAAPGPVRVMTMRLDPSELGTVTVRMRLVGGALELHFHAASETTAGVLERDRDALSDILRASGYDPGLIAIGQRPGMPPISGQPAAMTAAPGFPQHGGTAEGETNGRPPQDRRGERPAQPSSNQGYQDDSQTARNGASGALYV